MQVIPFQPPQQSLSGPFLGYGLLAVAARLIYKAIEKVDRAADSVADLFGDAAEELTTEATSAATLTIQLMKALAVVWFIANACRIVTRLVTGLRVVRAYAFRAAPADNQEYEQDSEVESEYMTHGPINLSPTSRLLLSVTHSNASSRSRSGTPSPQRRPRSTSPSPSNASSSSSRIAQGGPES